MRSSLPSGYLNYATQSDTIPGKATASVTGVGSRPAGTGDFANCGTAASWSMPPVDSSGNVTTVGTNGGPSAYGAYDMTGNLREWTNDGTNQAVWTRGGAWDSADNLISSEFSRSNLPSVSTVNTLGFRIVSVPEPSTCVMALAGLAYGGYSLVWRRRARPGYTRPAHQGSRSN